MGTREAREVKAVPGRGDAGIMLPGLEGNCPRRGLGREARGIPVAEGGKAQSVKGRGQSQSCHGAPEGAGEIGEAPGRGDLCTVLRVWTTVSVGSPTGWSRASGLDHSQCGVPNRLEQSLRDPQAASLRV